MTDKRIIHTNNYNEFASVEAKNFVQGNYIAMSQDLTHAATQIHELLRQLQDQGSTANSARQTVAEDLARQAKSNSSIMKKLCNWGQALADTTSKTSVSEASKLVVTAALKLAGVPMP